MEQGYLLNLLPELKQTSNQIIGANQHPCLSHEYSSCVLSEKLLQHIMYESHALILYFNCNIMLIKVQTTPAFTCLHNQFSFSKKENLKKTLESLKSI